jgi:hypothetical protein
MQISASTTHDTCDIANHPIGEAMTDEELKDALDGLFAYDTGCIDGGIHDVLLKQRVRAEVMKDCREHQMFSDRLSRIARELYLSDDSIVKGYGLEDIVSFAEWVESELYDD